MANKVLGHIESIAGKVTVLHKDGSGEFLTLDAGVYLDDVIAAGKNSHVRIQLVDGSGLKLESGQTAVLDTGLVGSIESHMMATVPSIGILTSVHGDVQIVRDGQALILKAGDSLLAGDILKTGLDSAASLRMLDGSNMNIGPDFLAHLNDDLFPSNYERYLSQGLEDPATIQAAILAGQDPSKDLPPPGIGESGNEGGEAIVISLSDRAVTPESGHDTHDQELPFRLSDEEMLQYPVNVRPDDYPDDPPDAFPDALDDVFVTDEDSVLAGDVSANDTVGNAPATFEVGAGPGNGTLEFNPDGTFSYTPNPDFNGPDSFTYVVTDADGDQGTATVGIQVDPVDDFPVAGVVSVLVDEDGLPSGNDDVAPGDDVGLDELGVPLTNETVATGTLTFSYGGDGAGDVDFISLDGTTADFTSQGSPVVYSWDGAAHTLTAATSTATVFTLVLEVDGLDIPTGAYSLALVGPVDHDIPGTEDNITVTLPFVVTDVDGDAVDGAIAVNIDDDVPVVSDLALGEVTEACNPQNLGSAAIVLGMEPGADGLQSVVFTPDQPNSGTLQIVDGDLVYTPPVDVDNSDGSVSQSFTVEVTDGDGDTATSTVTVDVVRAKIVVGSNADDSGPDDGIDPHILNETGVTSGEINGTASPDILNGDLGGAASTNTNANIILMLDTSGSMGSPISFTDSTGVTSSMTRLDAQKLAVNSLLNEMATSGASEVRVYIIEFNMNASSLGSFDLKTGNGLQEAIDAVNSTENGGATNYEAGLQQAINWSADPGNLLSGGNVVNQAIFVSDGKPNLFIQSDGSVSGTVSASTAMSQILGTDSSGQEQDTTNEVQTLENQFGPIEAVGIAITRQSSINNLDQVEGEPRSSESADNISTANELISVLSDLNPLNQLTAAGDDVINGGDGNDFIFGDAPFTDILAETQGVSLPPGSGWQVFADLEATSNWSHDDTANYVRNNHVELGAETIIDDVGRLAGHDSIDAGAGDDVVYGQEGDDSITGGSGDDILSGGSGADMFIWTADESGLDRVVDFNTEEGDVLNIADLLVGVDNPTAGELDGSYLSVASGSSTTITIFGDSGNADQVIELAGYDTTGRTGIDILNDLLAGPSPGLIVD